MRLHWIVAGIVVAAPLGAEGLTRAAASRFAGQVLKSVEREYPNKLDHTMAGVKDVKGPRELHPAFYGCFDWHSCVHGHWMLVRILKTFPDLPEAGGIRLALDRDLAPENIAAEVAYFVDPGHRGFERTYGWAWLLKLAAELRGWDAPEAREWARQLQPLTDAVVAQFEAFLPKLSYPNRVGVHPNTAFSLDLALDYARAAKDAKFEALLTERARTYFGKDRKGPMAWEPGGEDFLSPCLEEAALMAKVLPAREFKPWVEGFLPGLLKTGLLAPAVVSDRSDPRIVHLDGLNLSRARCLHALAAGLGPRDPRAKALEKAALEHAEAALPHVVSGNYEGDHWLATFAVQLLGERR
ncbi:DUF2891 domain-containing protein [Mesoterricola silvestris]|uniref:DUF2891 domain-containing protein n=1 Tax=Mesoterricola silvestris TaxID=2927979 RepID=A0AA48GTP9_9BACT|nr:DUF2891 domain-containing protein [Mesoterricola silvestris]BDU74175.1 hypothetical protein METEAL_33490 [Mesoterricola silvestris]